MGAEIVTVSLGGASVTLYALLAAAGFVCAALLSRFILPKRGPNRGQRLLFAAVAGIFSLGLGRLIFCLVRFDSLFFDEMGHALGIAPFFDTALGGVSMVGALLGLPLAALLCGAVTKKKAADYLDIAALPALGYFCFMRAIEPLCGQGYGDYLENSPFAFPPLAIVTEWGDAFVAVCWIEAILALIVLVALIFAGRKTRRPGTISLYAAALLPACQVLPECLRCDDALYIFIFARVTHIGYAFLLFFALLLPLIGGSKKGLAPWKAAVEITVMLLGLGLCIGTIFALDKTNLPKLLVYAVMALDMAGLAFLACRRIYKEDCRPC